MWLTRVMSLKLWLLIALLLVAALVGAGGILASVEGDRFTATEAFCTSCHNTMTLQADDPYFQQSAHRSNHFGVQPSCADCHIPRNNWFIETYTHVTKGMKDVYVQSTRNFSDPKAWEALRIELEPQVRAEMHAQDSVTCRSCHDADAIMPTSDAGRQSHALLRQGVATCVDCHTNIVHPPATPSAQTK